jgi:hypothetical protein
MIIKKYLDFIRESYEDFDSFGQWIDSLSDDPQILRIVNRYINDDDDLYGGEDVDPTINLSNAINLLHDRIKEEIKEQIQDYLDKGVEEKDPDILVSTETDELLESVETPDITLAGKGIFSSFLKSLTALGQKESNPNWDQCPDDFLVFYLFKDLDSHSVKTVFSRFKSLQRYLDLIDYGQNQLNLYFGINTMGLFEYGIQYEMRKPIGQFKLSKSIIKWMVSLDSKSAQSIKKEIVNLTYSDILVLGQIKRDMMDFKPAYFEKKLYPMLRDKVITFGFYGIGKWDNGKLDEGEYLNIKSNFTNWLMSKKWGGKVLISIKPESFWLYFHIKLK